MFYAGLGIINGYDALYNIYFILDLKKANVVSRQFEQICKKSALEEADDRENLCAVVLLRIISAPVC